MKNFKKILFYFKFLFKKEIEMFELEVPTSCKSQKEKDKLIIDIFEILEHEIKIH